MPVPFAIFILVIAHFFDWASFLVMVGRHGLGAEGNPLVVHVATQWGLPGLTITKIAAVALSAAVFAVLLPKNRKLAMLVLAFGVFAGAFGTISNVISM
jgi:hypothetical protein